MSNKQAKQLDVKLHNFMVSQMKVNDGIGKNIRIIGTGLSWLNNVSRGLMEIEERRQGVYPVCIEAIR